MQMVQSKQLGPNQVADEQMRALIIEAQNSNDPSRIIGRMMDLQREGKLRQALMPGTVTGAVDGPASPEEAQLGQMVEGFDRATINDLGQQRYEKAEGLGKYAPGNSGAGIDPSVEPERFKAEVDLRTDQLIRMYPKGDRGIMRAAMEREVRRGRSEDLPTVAVSGENRKPDTAKENALKLAFHTADDRRAEAVRTLRDNPDAKKQADLEAAAQRAEAAANMAQRNLMEFYTSSAAPQAPEQAPAAATGPGKLTDAEIDEMLARGMTTEEIEAIDAQR
jgi:hypothetical protein